MNILNEVNQSGRQIALAEINKNPLNVLFDYIQLISSARPQFITDYRQALSSKQKEIGELVENDVYKIIEAVNKTKSLEILNTNINLLDKNDLGNLVGWSWRSDSYSTYVERILNHPNYGSLTLEQVKAIINEVDSSEGLTKINNDPENIVMNDLSRILGWEDLSSNYFEDYKSAIINQVVTNQTPIASVEELRQLVLNVNQNAVNNGVAQINENPDSVTVELLNKLEIWGAQEAALEYYVQAIKATKGSENKVLTLEEIRQAISTGNTNYQNAQRQIAVDEINQNPNTFTLETIKLLRSWATEERLEYYRAAILGKLAEKGSALTFDEINQCIYDGDQKFYDDAEQRAVNVINADPQGFTYETLKGIKTYNIYSERLEYYRAAIIKKQQERMAPLTVEEVRQSIQVGNGVYEKEQERLALEEINHNPSGFSLDTLRKIVHIDYLHEGRFTEYRNEIAEWKTINGEIDETTISLLIEKVDKELSLVYIHGNLDTFEHWHLYEVLKNNSDNIYAKSNNLEQYRPVIKEAIQSSTNNELTAEEITSIVNNVNKSQSVQYIVNNLTNFSAYNLSEVVGWENVTSEHIEYYRTAIKNYLQENTTISFEELTELVKKVSIDTWLLEINTNPSTVSIYTLRDLFEQDYERVYDFVLWKYEDQYHTALTEKRTINGVLTKAQVHQIIERVNQEEFTKEQDAKVSKILDDLETFINGN